MKKMKNKLKKKKSKRRRTDIIFRYLMKGVSSFNLGTLSYHPVPSKQRLAYNKFIDKLQLATSSVKETKLMLTDVSNPSMPKTQIQTARQQTTTNRGGQHTHTKYHHHQLSKENATVIITNSQWSASCIKAMV